MTTDQSSRQDIASLLASRGEWRQAYEHLRHALELVRAEEQASTRKAMTSPFEPRTPAEFGKALARVMQEEGRTQGDIVRRDARTGQWLSKSTVSRMVNGTTIGRRREQVEAFIRACGGEELSARAWGRAWQEMRAKRAAARSDDGTVAHEAAVHADVENLERHADAAVGHRAATEPDAVSEAPKAFRLANVVRPAARDDDALMDVHIRVTKDEIRMSAPVLAAMGLLSLGSQPDEQTMATMVVLAAGGMALLNLVRRTAQPDSPIGDVLTERPAEVFVTAPMKQSDMR